MWSLNECKHVFLAIGLIGIVLCFAPTIARVVSVQPQDPFSELYILGPSHMANDYPFNVSSDTDYILYLCVGDHMGSSMYYQVDVMLRNESESMANGTASSSLPALYQYNVFLGDGQVLEDALTFSFPQVVSSRNVNCTIDKMKLNNAEIQLNKTVVWDKENNGFYYQLLVELWSYNQTSDGLQYDGRYVSLWLNMTSTG